MPERRSAYGSEPVDRFEVNEQDIHDLTVHQAWMLSELAQSFDAELNRGQMTREHIMQVLIRLHDLLKSGRRRVPQKPDLPWL